MNISSQFTSIRLDTLLIEDDTYELYPYDEIPHKDFKTSIQQFGILHPPVVLQLNNTKHIIVTGKKRIKTLLNVRGDTKELLCLRLSPGTDDAKIFSILVEESLTGNPLSLVEQAVFFNKAQKKCTPDELLVFLQKLGHKPQHHCIRNLLDLLLLGKKSIQALHEGSLQYNNARKLLKLSEPDQNLLVERITSLHLGGSKQKKLIELCTELIMRNSESLDSILSRFDHQAKSGSDGNIPQQTSVLFNWLNKECWPSLSEAKATFERLTSQIHLPPQCRIQHSKSFESDNVTLTIHFKNLTSLVNALPEITRALPDKTAE